MITTTIPTSNHKSNIHKYTTHAHTLGVYQSKQSTHTHFISSIGINSPYNERFHIINIIIRSSTSERPLFVLRKIRHPGHFQFQKIGLCRRIPTYSDVLRAVRPSHLRWYRCYARDGTIAIRRLRQQSPNQSTE